MENSYFELKEKYGRVFKKWSGVSELYDTKLKIILSEQHFEKIGNRFVEKYFTTKQIDFKRYLIILDWHFAFRNEHKEKITCGYTIGGYFPTEIVTTEKNGAWKTIRKISIER